MSISETRLGGNATGLPAVQAEPVLPAPAPLPGLAAAFSRRRAILGVAALASVPAAALTAAAAPVDPDAALIALGREWQASAVRQRQAEAKQYEAEDRTPDVPPPEPLFLRATDDSIFGALSTWYQDSERRWFWPDSVEALRSAVFPRDRNGISLRNEARRDEIVAAGDTWRAEVAAASATSGFTAAEAMTEAEVLVNRELRRRIMMTRAVTLPGVLLKARVAGWCFQGSAGMHDDIEDEGEGSSALGEDVAFSAVADLVAMIERGTA